MLKRNQNTSGNFDQVYHLSRSDADTTDSADLLLSKLGEELCLDDDGLVGDNTVTENLVDTSLDAVNDRDLTISAGSSVGLGLLRNEGPDLINVDGRAVELLHGLVEVTHTNLTEVTRMVLVEVGAVMVHTTGITTTTRVRTVLT